MKENLCEKLLLTKKFAYQARKSSTNALKCLIGIEKSFTEVLLITLLTSLFQITSGGET